MTYRFNIRTTNPTLAEKEKHGDAAYTCDADIAYLESLSGIAKKEELIRLNLQLRRMGLIGDR